MGFAVPPGGLVHLFRGLASYHQPYAPVPGHGSYHLLVLVMELGH